MKKFVPWIAVAAVVVGGAGYWAWTLSREPEPVPMVAAPAPVAPAPLPDHYPVETPTTPLPPLDASDGSVGEAVAQLIGLSALPDFFYPEQMIRRVVATVDNLPRARVSSRLMPVAPVAGSFRVRGTDDALALDPANAARYRLYLELLEKVDPKQAIDVYTRFYPLFQQAYQELGYPKGYFNDRLVEVFDDLLAAPEVAPPVMLVQPHVLYRYADPDLEALSAGQKILVRMGSANGARAKAAIRALREELLLRTPPVPR